MIPAAHDPLLISAGALAITWVSRKPLRVPGSHGFYRYFGWLALLALVVRNRGPWGEDPFSPHQLLSWPLLIASILLVGAGWVAMKRHGKASAARGDTALYAFESTTQVVSSGIYRYIRHPMYTSLILLTWGAFCQSPDLAGTAIALFASLFFLLTALADERECLAYFGPPYADYMLHTRRFIPGVF